jgi:hypothetical protein
VKLNTAKHMRFVLLLPHENRFDLGSGLAGGGGGRWDNKADRHSWPVTDGIKNTFGLSAVVYCACEKLLSLSVILYLIKAAHEFNLNLLYINPSAPDFFFNFSTPCM